MTDPRDRALRALGYTRWGGDGNNSPVWEKDGCPKLFESAVDEDKLVGMLLKVYKRLYKLPDWNYVFWALEHQWHGSRVYDLLEALTAAVEATKEKP